MSNIGDFDTSRRFKGTVVETVRITPENAEEEVRHITLRVNLSGLDFSEFETVGVVVLGPNELGRPLLLRLYAVAGYTKEEPGGNPTIELCVRRCFYVDDFSGERYPGTVSSWLCDLREGETVDLTGPFGNAFPIPENPDANLILIGQGTGIAPFRTLVQRLYENPESWTGEIRLFHGAKTGLELLYNNDENADLGLYMQHKTFKAIQALSPKPHFGEPAAMDQALTDNAADIWALLESPNTYVYVAGLRQMNAQLDRAFAEMAGSPESWASTKDGLVSANRWRELLY